jgi:hypothetical protein
VHQGVLTALGGPGIATGGTEYGRGQQCVATYHKADATEWRRSPGTSRNDAAEQTQRPGLLAFHQSNAHTNGATARRPSTDGVSEGGSWLTYTAGGGKDAHKPTGQPVGNEPAEEPASPVLEGAAMKKPPLRAALRGYVTSLMH